MGLNDKAPVPIYYQIKEEILEKILSGELNPEDKIPSEEKIAQTYNISRMTARHAVTQLVNEGYLYRIHGKGTFVCRPRVEKSFSYLSSFARDMMKKGYRPSSLVLRNEVIQAEPEIAESLQLKPGEKVIVLIRVRLANGKPLAYQECFLPAQDYPGLEKFDFGGESSLYEVLAEEYDVEPFYADQRVDGRSVAGEIARALELEEGAAVLYSERITYREDNRPMELVHTWYRGDKYVFEVKLYKEM